MPVGKLQENFFFPSLKSLKRGVASGVGSGSIRGADPRIRIRIKMSRIPNTASCCTFSLSAVKKWIDAKHTSSDVGGWAQPALTLPNSWATSAGCTPDEAICTLFVKEDNGLMNNGNAIPTAGPPQLAAPQTRRSAPCSLKKITD